MRLPVSTPSANVFGESILSHLKGECLNHSIMFPRSRMDYVVRLAWHNGAGERRAVSSRLRSTAAGATRCPTLGCDRPSGIIRQFPDDLPHRIDRAMKKNAPRAR